MHTARKELDQVETTLRVLGARRGLGTRSSYTTVALWAILIALFLTFYRIFSRA